MEFLAALLCGPLDRLRGHSSHILNLRILDKLSYAMVLSLALGYSPEVSQFWFLVVAMMLSLFWQVFTRFIIKVPATWTEEIARYTFIYMVMIGAALGVRHSAHFGVTMLSDKLHGKARLVRRKRGKVHGANLGKEE